jgi:hypothetical protein
VHGILESFFTQHRQQWGPVGFDTKGTPFGQLTDTASVYSQGYQHFCLEDFCDGFIYQCPLSAYQPVTILEDFITEKNIKAAREYSPDPDFKHATVKDFKNDALDDLNFKKKFPNLW